MGIILCSLLEYERLDLVIGFKPKTNGLWKDDAFLA